MENLLEVIDLKVTFPTSKGRIRAIDGVNFKVKKGEILGIVGESGSGKSISSLSIMGLISDQGQVEGKILFNDENLLNKTEVEMRKIRGDKISMIFQDPMSSLNPVFTIGNQISEAILLHNKGVTKKEAVEKTIELLKLVGLPSPEQRIHDYPHKFSGGMRQRAMIAMALACEPELLVADEPTTALDVTIQAQILELLKEIQMKLGMSIILITHDLGVVAETCHRVAVMYAGHVVEETDVYTLFANPKHPYTKGLINSLPKLGSRERLTPIQGQPPQLYDDLTGCRFASRCPFVSAECLENEQVIAEVTKGHFVRCHKEVG
ncbi:ABC transporter ATP-binding protein [Paenisporosarcina sp. TG20]|uniref:ABC transporter ATP-binding protein n=1 Tax=Paenisporosarcina sp. TG20 TaxID=1211706 RepID=UPI00031B65A8|nr:ABC transporter ATP-binding protein [Paenisporosarcina sp. TG20]